MMMEQHKMGSDGGAISDEGVEEFFPEGLKVLAVDDNPICLKLLETSLKKLQYQVTTTNQATKALEMLRENKDRFDLVISDVEMPDMDGLKLLELVGLEMDLPVIMLSAHGDYKLVKEGIKHGACDYMLKPVSMQQLKNIWQHVFRRKRLESKKKLENPEIALNANDRGGRAALSTANADTDAKYNRKRKDQNEEDEDDGEETGHDDDDSSSQKKPRVVWSVDLHKKFVWAVNQLGYEKAVPKKILDLMNVEGLTRENVASHLQKFRLYLKKTSQQCNLGAGFGGKDSSYMRLESLTGYGDFRAFGGSGRLSTVSLSAYPPGGMLRRLNTPTGLGLRGITTSSTLVQPTMSHNSSDTISTLGKLQSGSLTNTRNTGLLQGMPAALELNNIQQNNTITDIASFRTDPGFINPTQRAVCLNNSMPSLSSNQLTLPGTSRLTKGAEESGTQAARETESLPSRLLNGGSAGPISMGENRCNESWPNPVSMSNFSSANPLQTHEAFSHLKQQSIDSREGFSSANPLLQKNSTDFSSTGLFSSDMAIYGGDMDGQGGLLGNGQDLSFTYNNKWGDYGQDYQSNFGTFNSAVSATVPSDSLSQNTEPRNPFGNKASNCIPFCPSTTGAPSFQHREYEISSTQMNTNSSTNCYVEQAKLLGGPLQSHYEPFDDLVSGMIKQEPNGSMTVDGDFFI